MSHDRYARLRDNLAVHRAATAARDTIAWCRECQLHHADDSGFCPVCRPVEVLELPERPELSGHPSYGDAA